MKSFFRYIFFLLLLLCAALTACDGRDTPHDHTAVSWQTVEAPTCAGEGRAIGKCSVCREDMETTLSPLAHTLTSTVTLPTCTEEGYTRYTCDCGFTYDSDTVAPMGHTLVETVTLPTCTEEGYTRYTCSCGYTYDSNMVAPLNHSLTVDTVYYPTVLRDGYTLHTCTVCGQSYEDTVVRYADIVTGAYTANTEILMQGIDVSKWNHEYGTSLEDIKPLNWAALKAAGVDFVILKAGSTRGIDPAFEMNYRDAKAAGLQVGAYFYIYSTTVEGVVSDAEMLLAWLEGKQFEFPIYFDLEDPSLMSLGGDLLTEMCKTFAVCLQEVGYYAALYTNIEWLYEILDTEWILENLDVWFACYTASIPDGENGVSLEDSGFTWKDGTAYEPGRPDHRFGVWQYTDSGVVEGFRYKFDFNYAFKDYASIMSRWGLNGFTAASA